VRTTNSSGNESAVSNQWALLCLRLVVGAGFVLHGWAKWSRGPEKFGLLLQQIGVPFPEPTAWVVTVLELFGGVMILAGVFVMAAGLPLIVTMLVALFTVHWKHGFSAIKTTGLTKDGPMFGPPGYEVNLLYIAALLVLAFATSHPFSVARWFRCRRMQSSGCQETSVDAKSAARRVAKDVL
jgi:putative oxidoreductase